MKIESLKGTLFYDRSFLTIFPMSIFEINTEDVYISRKTMMIKTARAKSVEFQLINFFVKIVEI